MKNKIDLKKYLLLSFSLLIILTIAFILINNYQIKVYRNNYNNKINAILTKLNEYYPDLSKREIVNILNSDTKTKNSFLHEYGIDIDKESIVLSNNIKEKQFIITNGLFMFFSFLILLSLFLIYLYKKDKKLKEITKLIEEINKKNYSLNIDNFNEDELSILKSELYKTTIFLKEQAENSINDKNNLKNSLEDISHQLKTPLTSIMISLDNLIDTENIDENTRNIFLYKIKREISNINFLIVSLLNLSKLDTNNIKFINNYFNLYDLIKESIKNISTLSDIKNIKVNLTCKDNIKLYCDMKWQIEAITNILKNAIEHSKNGENIKITCEENKLFIKIVINNNEIINKKDLPNIFKRFYTGKNGKSDSIGIGLALSKSIIEKNNGKVSVESNANIGTNFIIKYFKN